MKARMNWIVFLVTGLAFFGCKPKQIISERVVSVIDSSAVLIMKGELTAKDKQIENLQTDLQAARAENIRLQSEVSTYEIIYDTNAPVSAESGRYPIASEKIIESKTLLEKTIREFEILKQEYNNEIIKLSRVNQNLEYTIKALKDENRVLKEKTTPTTGFNFRLFMLGIVTGIILIILIVIFIRV